MGSEQIQLTIKITSANKNWNFTQNVREFETTKLIKHEWKNRDEWGLNTCIKE